MSGKSDDDDWLSTKIANNQQVIHDPDRTEGLRALARKYAVYLHTEQDREQRKRYL